MKLLKLLASAVVLGTMLVIPSMASEKKATFSGSIDDVFNAAQLSAHKEWALSYSDRSTHLMSFVTGRSFASRGMECSVTLRPAAQGQVEVVVHTQKKNNQKFAFGAGDRIAKKFFAGIKDELERDKAAPEKLSSNYKPNQPPLIDNR